MTTEIFAQRQDAKTSMLEAALAMVRLGLKIFPCGADKQPLTPHGFKDATDDEAAIHALWTRWPDAGIGVPTGKVNDMIVLDVDMDGVKGVDGEAALQALLTSEAAVIPTTRTVRTPRGGRHLYFKHPGWTVKNSTSKIGPGLDIRGDGGYVIAPPSRNGNGQDYEIEVEVPIADLPGWLEKLVVEPVRQPTSKPGQRFDDTPDRAKIEDALRCVSADCSFDDWLRVGMALNSWSPAEGCAIWDAWSRTAPGRYEEAAIDRHWKTFKDKGGGVTIASLFKMAIDAGWKPQNITKRNAEKAAAWAPPTEDAKVNDTSQTQNQDQSAAMPIVILPHGIQPISATGHALGTLLARTERFFVRGGAVAKLTRDFDGLPVLDDVHPATLASDFETVAVLCKIEEGKPKPATCSETTAKLISASAAFRNAMSPLTVLTRCPVLIDRAGKLMQICGYDRQSGIFAAGQPAEAMSIDEARRLLYEILSDFKFATRADRARALAAMITPSLIFGGLLRYRAPVDLGEANDSQSGKGFRNRQTAALYAQSVKNVAQKKGGVGSMEENFNMALIRGANFISLDNVRGKLDSPSIESFLTEDNYLARGPYMAPTEIDPRRIVVMMTSNKADITPDFAKRCSCVRILKQDDGYVFKPYPEGDILEHIRANQPRFLGAVFSIIFAWNAAGRPKTTETRHDFRPWAQTLDWITQNLLDAGPLLDGHRETQARMTNPVLNWLRDVAIEIIRAKQVNAWLRASDLVDLLAETAIETPGLPEHGDLTDPETRKSAQQATGRKLGLCFRAGDILTLDGMTIERREEYDPASRYTVREYRFTAAAMEPEPIAAQPAAASETPHERTPEQVEIDLCGYAAASRAASHAAKETPIAANAADTYLQGDHLDTLKDIEGVNICAMGTISRIAAKSATEDKINNAFDLSSRADHTDTEEGEI